MDVNSYTEAFSRSAQQVLAAALCLTEAAGSDTKGDLTNLSNSGKVWGDGSVIIARGYSQRHCQICGRLCEYEASNHICVAVNGVQP